MRRTGFPLVVLALSLALAGFMAYAFTRPHALTPASALEQPSVDTAAYRSAFKAAFEAYKENDAAAQTSIERLVVAERTMRTVLALRVPAEDQETHLAFVVALNQVETGLRGDDKVLKEGERAIETLRAKTDWLKSN